MIIKSKGNNAIIFFSIIAIIVYYFIMIVTFGKDFIIVTSLISVLLLVLIIRYWIATGKTIIINEYGCSISFLGFKREYKWDELETKHIEYYNNSIEYRTLYHGGVVFSEKEIKKPKWVKAATYSIFIHPISVFFIYFKPKRPKLYYKYPQIYEIEKGLFIDKMREWKVDIKGL